MKNYSVQSVLDWLETKNYLTQRRFAEAYVLSHANMTKLPLYVHFLMGVGAMLGFICVMGFLFTTIIHYDDIVSLFSVGFISMLLALLAYYTCRYKTPIWQSLGLQSALILMIVGKVLVVMGFEQLANHSLIPLRVEWAITLGILLVTLPTYVLFPNPIDRFLSSTATLTSLLYNSLFLYSTNVTFFGYFCLLMFLAGFLFIWRNKSLSWSSLNYALVITLCESVLLLPFFSDPSYLKVPSFAFNGVLGIALIFLCLILAQEKRQLFGISTLLACLAVLALAFVSTPGILLALGLLILGYAKHEMALNIIGGAFLCLFLILFYYELPFTLDYKAALLISTGVIMLAIRLFVKLMRWDDSES
ncbi:MAG: DUF4401 domain-containing protein [Proteobacteria bacterium]|nr:DUF4401 domain-containing protein [Pseudomonadota bacterium]